jgi:hypothetical protein
MNCRDVEKNVLALVESTLPREVGEPLEAHISQCGKCRALRDFVSDAMSEAEGPDEIDRSPNFWPRLNARIEDYEEGRAGWLSRKPRLRPVTVAACMLLGIWGGTFLGSSYSERVFPPPDEPALVQESPVSVLEGIPRGSLAEILIEQILEEGSEP